MTPTTTTTTTASVKSRDRKSKTAFYPTKPNQGRLITVLSLCIVCVICIYNREMTDLETVLNRQRAEHKKARRKRNVDSEELNEMDNKITAIISEMKHVAAVSRTSIYLTIFLKLHNTFFFVILSLDATTHRKIERPTRSRSLLSVSSRCCHSSSTCSKSEQSFRNCSIWVFFVIRSHRVWIFQGPTIMPQWSNSAFLVLFR